MTSSRKRISVFNKSALDSLKTKVESGNQVLAQSKITDKIDKFQNMTRDIHASKIADHQKMYRSAKNLHTDASGQSREQMENIYSENQTLFKAHNISSD